ncbi:Glycosyl transferase family 2 [anaerobic digester metagenome]
MTETYIITPDYNGTKFLEGYFHSLFNQTYHDFKVVFVDNSPNDDSIRFIKENYSPEIKNKQIIMVKNPENYGFARANNIGIQKALEDKSCRYLICLNNDTTSERDFLMELVNCAERHPDAGSIQSKMIWGLNQDMLDSVGIEYAKNGLSFNRGEYQPSNSYNEEEEIFGSCAGASLYRRKALEEIGDDGEYFDADFFAYYEDFDLALRLRWAGWSAWYCPNALVYHYKGGTKDAKSDFTVYHNWRNYTWTLFKELPTSYIIRNLHRVLVAELAQIGINLVRRKPIIFRAKWDAYRNIGKFLKKKKNIKRVVPLQELEKWFIDRWK